MEHQVKLRRVGSLFLRGHVQVPGVRFGRKHMGWYRFRGTWVGPQEQEVRLPAGLPEACDLAFRHQDRGRIGRSVNP